MSENGYPKGGGLPWIAVAGVAGMWDVTRRTGDVRDALGRVPAAGLSIFHKFEHRL